MTYRTKIFVAALGAAAAALAVAAALVSWSLRRDLEARLERTLVSHTALAAAAVEARAGADLDRLAGELARMSGARVTIVGGDGRVLGDSDVPPGELASLENHSGRPELVAAETRDVGIVRRYSTTVGYEMLYSARKLSTSGDGGPGWVRLALPLTEIGEQLAATRRALWPGFAAAIALALGGAWAISRQLTRRLRAIAIAAERHSLAGSPEPVPAEGRDEIARVARLVNDSSRALQNQLSAVAGERALLSAILSGMIEGVIVVDEKGRVQLANDAASRMLGVSTPQSLQGSRYVEVVRHPEVAEHLSRALRGETTRGTELVLHRDPHRTYIARAAPVRVRDDVTSTGGAVLVLHDITELRRADRVRRDFVANVSHELRTPLTAIRGYVEALLDNAEGPDQSRRFLEIVERHAARMERLVSDLLRLARLDAGQEQIAVGPVPLASALSAVESELAPAILGKHITVERRIGSQVAVINADPAKLHDVLRNLLENAVNYSPERGTVVVSADLRDGRLWLQIEDEGPGIPPTDLERVFERFYRVDKSRTKDPGGTGLGLAIVKHLVGLHGGSVTAANRSPQGARLTVTLPQPSASAG